MGRLILLSITDFKLIFRDPSLRIFLAMPLIIFAVVLLGVPKLVEAFAGVEEYIPLILMGATMQTSTMFGFVYSFVLIDEKDIGVAKAYGVLPVSKTGFVASRMVIPFVLSTLMTLALLIVQPFYSFALVAMILLSVLCGLVAPLLTILVTILSKNKMEGMTWFKLINLLVTIPLAAFFIPEYALLFGIIPTHWAFQMLGEMVAGESWGMEFFVGLGFVLGLLALGIKKFARGHFV